MFSAARNATIPSILTGDKFTVGMSIVNVTDFVSQLAGFTTGGVLVAFLGGPHVALAVDAVTYVISAVVVRLGIRPHRPDLRPGRAYRYSSRTRVHAARPRAATAASSTAVTMLRPTPSAVSVAKARPATTA